MFSLLLKLKRGIKKLLKVTSESRQPVRASTYSRTLNFLLLALVSALIGVLYSGEELYDPLDTLRRGDIAQEDVIAPFQIIVRKTEAELETDRDRIRNTLPYIVDYDSVAARRVYEQLDDFFELIESLKGSTDTLERNSELERDLVLAVSRQYPLLSEPVATQSLRLANLSEVRTRMRQIFEQEIYGIGVLSDLNTIPEKGSKYVLLRRGERENIYSKSKLSDLALANGRLLTVLNRLRTSDSIDVDYYYPLGQALIKPNIRVNMGEYNRRLDEELASISIISEIVNPGDTIVRAFSKVDRRQQRILEEKKQIERSLAAQRGWLVSFMPVLARIILVLAAFAALYLFLYYFRRELYNSNPKLLALLLVFALQLFVIHLERSIFSWDISIYLYLVAILPVMVTILFDAEVGILSTLVLAVILGMMHRFNFTLAFMTVVVGATACFASREVRRRSHFFRIMLFIALAYAIFILLVENLKVTPSEELLTDTGFGIAAGVLSVLLTMGFLPFFESVFSITTDITLLELSDLNHPLLKRLAIEAPGTYHHSIVVGTLAEAAAKGIGANHLLARVGCYYHDIGKIEVPDYFVENQLSLKSKHESLTPSMSSLILTSHVKKGRFLGEEADLPNDVLNFIEEHHGTMVMTYFYNKALEQGADQTAVDKFRYPGPKPQIRETGIAMLADAAEAASRTLEDPKPARINNLIQRIINDRFQSGELDECPLTLRDLAKIKEAFAQILIGTFHHRIVYPKKKEETEEVGLE